MNFPSELRYTKDHEWIRVDGTTGTIGITEYAQGELGDIVFVELSGKGTKLVQGKPFGTIEAVKAVSELFAPVSGEVLEANKAVQETPEVVNKEPYGSGWMIKVKLENPKEADALLSVDAYKKLIGQ
ncbi:MAG: glycine cleavage system protein GcvH [Bacteroidota bacterium]